MVGGFGIPSGQCKKKEKIAKHHPTFLLFFFKKEGKTTVPTC
jgi:hypothetical protein